MEGSVVVSDGKGGKKKVMTMEDVTPKNTRDEQLAPLRNLLHKLLVTSSSSLLPSLNNDTINCMGFADLRDATCGQSLYILSRCAWVNFS